MISSRSGGGVDGAGGDLCADVTCPQWQHCEVLGKVAECTCDEAFTQVQTLTRQGSTYQCAAQTHPWAVGATSPDTLSAVTKDLAEDSRTGLMWERGPGGNPSSWEDAKARCASLGTGGHTDWRLPTVIELASLVDYTRNSLAITDKLFPGTLSTRHWTASTVPQLTSKVIVWRVHFEGGRLMSAGEELHPSRSVRTAPTVSRPCLPSPRFVLQEGDTVIQDGWTGRQWLRATGGPVQDTVAAGKWCAGQSAGGGGWRLPTITELLTTPDYRHHDPAVDEALWGKETSSGQWSSTPSKSVGGETWSLSFLAGAPFRLIDHWDRGNPALARCVREP